MEGNNSKVNKILGEKGLPEIPEDSRLGEFIKEGGLQALPAIVDYILGQTEEGLDYYSSGTPESTRVEQEVETILNNP